MWDYDAFPVWSVADHGHQASVPQLPISGELAKALQAWSDEWSAEIWGEHGPDSPKWRAPSDEARSAWDARGRALVERLRAELGSDAEVGYFNEDTGQVEWPEGGL